MQFHGISPTFAKMNRTEFFELYFGELEKNGVPYVVLHSYQNFPKEFASDVDCAVFDADLPKIRALQKQIAGEWKLAQSIEHHIFAFCGVFVDGQNPPEGLRLDVCSHYAEGGCLLVQDSILMEGRRRERSFYIPAPSAEFAYILAKTFGKGKPIALYLPRLEELWREDPAGAQARFIELFGDTGRSLEQWFAAPAGEWEKLAGVMQRRNRYGWRQHLREARRILGRVLRPTGLQVTFLGPDGTGKSTAISGAAELLRTALPMGAFLHFRPKVFEKHSSGPVTDPHGSPPRGALSAWAKVLYYFCDHLIGYAVRVLPDKLRNRLVIFDRDFDDLLVDPRRYRLTPGTATLVRLLRKLLPKSDLVFVLDAEPEVIHRRKPELPVEELARQRQALRELAESSARYVLIDAGQPPDAVALAVARRVVEFLAAREARR